MRALCERPAGEPRPQDSGRRAGSEARGLAPHRGETGAPPCRHQAQGLRQRRDQTSFTLWESFRPSHRATRRRGKRRRRTPSRGVQPEGGGGSRADDTETGSRKSTPPGRRGCWQGRGPLEHGRPTAGASAGHPAGVRPGTRPGDGPQHRTLGRLLCLQAIRQKWTRPCTRGSCWPPWGRAELISTQAASWPPRVSAATPAVWCLHPFIPRTLAGASCV